MRISEKGIEKLARWEGQIKKNGMHVMYPDASGFETIGIGHLLTEEELFTGTILIDGLLVPWTNGLTDTAAHILLSQDIGWAQDAVNEKVYVQLAQNQFDTLVSFVFNIGETNFSSSTLLKVLNEGNYTEVPTQLKRWNKSNGHVLNGLINRRQYEIDYWMS